MATIHICDRCGYKGKVNEYRVTITAGRDYEFDLCYICSSNYQGAFGRIETEYDKKLNDFIENFEPKESTNGTD